MTFDLPLPPLKYAKDQARIALVNDVTSRLGALPGTQSVGVTNGRPLGRMMMLTMFDIVGQPPNDPQHRTVVEVHPASPAFFYALASRSGKAASSRKARIGATHAPSWS